MKIVACYIVKDEGKNFLRSWESVKNAVDELVVVDTGSTDDTVMLAQKAGARIFSYKWQEDFAAARNFALDRLTGDWVVFLDADEYFSAETCGNLRKVITKQSADTRLILVQRQDLDESGKVVLSIYVPRIFRIDEHLRYKGAIHEELRCDGELISEIAVIDSQELTLMHTGYAGEVGIAKARRNLPLLLREMEKGEEPGRFYGYIAEAYDGIGDRENAMKYAYMDIARGRQAETYASRSYRLLLAGLAEFPQDAAERRKVTKAAVTDYPELPEFHAEYAEALAAVYNYDDAIASMEQAVTLGKTYHGLEPTVYDETMANLCYKRMEIWKKLQKIAAKIKISACVITKNEEKNITRWLANAGAYADECIVLDTGSTDKTCALAVASGAEVYEYDWQDDFAAAKNACLAKAKGDWVAFLDADEFFVYPEKLRGMLAFCQYFQPEIDLIAFTIVNVDEDDGDREISRFPGNRVFRRDSGLHYVGRVHESLRFADGTFPGRRIEEKLLIRHTGYSTSLVAAKNQRNLALLQADIAARGEGPEHYRYLADCYYGEGHYAEAELYALKAIDSPLQGDGTAGDMYYMVLNCMKELEEPLADRLQFAAVAAKKFPALPDFPAIKGLLYYGAGDYEKGAAQLCYALHLSAQLDGQESSSFGDIKGVTLAAYADCLSYLGRGEEAMRHSEAAMELNPWEEQALGVYCKLRRKNTDKLIEALTEYFADTKENIAFLCRFSERNGLGELYDFYRNKWQALNKDELPRQEYYALLTAGNWAKLADELQSGLSANLELSIALLLRLQDKEGRNYRQTEKQIVALLPPEASACWQGVWRGEAVMDWGIYKTLWQYVRIYGQPEKMEKFAAAAMPNADMWSLVLQDLIEMEAWQTVLNLLTIVPVDKADGKFWLVVGRCLYHLGEMESATEAFGKAREAGENGYMLNSYETWLGRENHA